MRHIFECIDGHTCGNPVRLVKNGPELIGNSMSEKRQQFLKDFDWIRTGLMFEPRGHDMMSGSILYPPQDPQNDIGVLFIETSGCLPMCGHGSIGTITIAIQEKLIHPKTKGVVRMETPAGLVLAYYTEKENKVTSVKLINIPSFLAAEGLKIESETLGELLVDISYGGNFYAIIDMQKNFTGIDDYPVDFLISEARTIRKMINEQNMFVHPENNSIRGCSHVLWAGKVKDPRSTARNAVVYGEKAIDRSPCGTGTSARMAQWYSKGNLPEKFIHESIIGSTFTGTVEEELLLNGKKAIRPGIQGWAKVFGYNTITIDNEDDPYAFGFQVV